MSFLIILSGIVGVLILLPLLAALFIRRNHYVRREVVINAPRQKIFDYLKFLKNQEEFNNRASAGEREKEFRGTDGTVGFTYAWSGDKKAGQGEKEIMGLVEGKKVEMEIRFIKPMRTSSRIVMEMESLSDNQTKVFWSNAGKLNYPMNIFVPMLEKGLPKDMDASLANLKNILERS